MNVDLAVVAVVFAMEKAEVVVISLTATEKSKNQSKDLLKKMTRSLVLIVRSYSDFISKQP